jgi:hypothetical protein
MHKIGIGKYHTGSLCQPPQVFRSAEPKRWCSTVVLVQVVQHMSCYSSNPLSCVVLRCVLQDVALTLLLSLRFMSLVFEEVRGADLKYYHCRCVCCIFIPIIASGSRRGVPLT